MAMDPVFISPRKRLSTDFMYKGEGKTNSGFKQPYRIWSWRQRELFRNVQEAQFEHMRRVYRRQWYEAYRVNAAEYIYKYNITKAAQLVQWEGEMEAQEATRRDAYQAAAGRQALRAKHLDLLREYHEKNFFAWYERASERLQYMAQTMTFLPKDGLDAHIEKELNKYVFEPNRAYPLNFAGQMPLLEDRDGQVVAAASHAFTKAAQHELPGLQKYDAPAMSATEANALAESISGNLRGVYYSSPTTTTDGAAAATADGGDTAAADQLNDELAAQVIDQMASEQEQALDESQGGEQQEDIVGNMADEDYSRQRRMYLDRGKTAQAKRATLFQAKKPGKVQSTLVETIHDTDTTVAEAEAVISKTLARERGNESKKGKQKQDKRDKRRAAMHEALDKNDAAAQQNVGIGADGLPTSGTRHEELDAALKKAQEEAFEERRKSSKKPVDPEQDVRAVKPKITEELLQTLMSKAGGSLGHRNVPANVAKTDNGKRKPGGTQ